MQDILRKLWQLCYSEGGTPEMLEPLLEAQNLGVDFQNLLKDIAQQCEIINHIIKNALPDGGVYPLMYDSGVLAAYAKDSPFSMKIHYNYTVKNCNLYTDYIKREGIIVPQETIAKEVAAAIDANSFAPKYTDLRIYYMDGSCSKFITVCKKV